MNPRLGDNLSEAQIVTDLRATNCWKAITELIDRLVEIGNVQSRHRVATAAAVRKRESAMSTGIGLGVGIPHASTNLVREVITAFGKTADQLRSSGWPTSQSRDFFLIPQGQVEKYLHTMVNSPNSCRKQILAGHSFKHPDAGVMFHIIRGLQTS